MDATITHVTRGNVFQDLKFSPDEAACLACKTDLMLALEEVVKQRRYSVAAAAKRFGVDPDGIAALKRGDLNFFTTDLLIQMLERAGKQVDVVITNKNHAPAA